MTIRRIKIIVVIAAAFCLLSISGPLGFLAAASAASPTTGNNSSPNCSDRSDSGIEKCLKTNPIVHDLNLIVGFLSALFGVIVVGSLIFAGIQYTTAGADASRVSAAKKRITNSLIALVAFICIVAFLQWIIPGGVLN